MFLVLLSVPNQSNGAKHIWHKFYLYFECRQAVDRDGSCSSPMETSDRPDLSLLKPLWSLYTSMLEKEGGEKAIKLRILNGFGSTALERELSGVSHMSIANGLPKVLCRSLKKVKTTVSSF